MKSFTRKLLSAVLIMSFAILQSSCNDDDAVTASGDVEILSISPDADADGNVRAFRGGQITISGNNLNKISHLTLSNSTESFLIGNENSYGLTEEEMESMVIFDNKSHTVISFGMPFLDLDMDQGLHKVEIVFYKYNTSFTGIEKAHDIDYYVATSNGFEVTDISYADLFPTVGSTATLRGGELNRVSSISIGEVTISSDDFVELNDERTQLSFLIPGGEYASGRNDREVKVYYDGGVLEISDKIIIYTPILNTPPIQTTPANLGDILSFSGEYINIIDSVFFDTSKAAILEEMTNENILTVRIPSRMDLQDPPVAYFEIIGYYGNPGQRTVLIPNYLVDTTPDENLMPRAESITVEDGGPDNEKFYLNKTVTVNGRNLAFVERITMGGIETVIDSKSATQITFKVPEDYDFETATVVEIVAIYEEVLTESFGMAKVYPFYYYKDVGLGIASNSAGEAGPDGSNNAVFLLNSGQVLSATEYWNTMAVDPGMLNNSAMSATHVIATDQTGPGAIRNKSDYYNVEPYFYLHKHSSHRIRMSSPASGTGSRYIRIYNGGTSYSQKITSDYKGTPMLTFHNLLNGPDALYADAVRDGSLETLEYTGTMPTGTDLWAVNASNSPGTGTWEVGSVLVCAYLTYEYGLTNNPGPTLDNAYKIGYLHVTSASGITSEGLTKLVDGRASGLVYFDIYWPKNSLRE